MRKNTDEILFRLTPERAVDYNSKVLSQMIENIVIKSSDTVSAVDILGL